MLNMLPPVWTYGIELWGCATKSNSCHPAISIQTSQN